MISLRKALILGVIASISLSHAEDAPVPSPHLITLCSQLLMSAPSGSREYRGDLHFDLRDVNLKILETLRNLNERPLTQWEQMRKRAANFAKWISGENLIYMLRGTRPDYTKPHDRTVRAVLLDPHKVKWTPTNEVLISALVGKIDQLEEDIISPQDLIGFGYELRGEEKIRGFLNETRKKAKEMEDQVRAGIDQRFPYFTKLKLFTRNLQGLFGASAFYLWGPLWTEEIHRIFTHQSWSLVDLLIQPYIMLNLGYPYLKAGITYDLGLISAKARAAYEDRETVERTANSLSIYDAMIDALDKKDKYPDAFIYNAMSTMIPIEFRTEILEASNVPRDINPELLQDAIIRDRTGDIETIDRNYMLVDQVFFYDSSTHEPVLANFIRLKRGFKRIGSSRKRQLERQSAPVTEDAYGTAPVGSR